MRATLRLFFIVLSVWLTTVPGRAMSGGCKEVPLELNELASAVQAGERLFAFLEHSDAEVAIVARVGTDQSKRGLRYTHAGLAWRDHPLGRWQIVHQLNHCATDRSDIFVGGAVSFFLERPFSYDAWVVIPTRPLQVELARLLSSDAARALHQPRYSAIAHPYRTDFQNSNQWILELIATALQANGDEIPASRQRAQSFLSAQGFAPERTRLGFFERVGARRADNVSLKDHRRRELREGGYQWVSVRSIVRFLEGLDLVERRQELRGAS